jgi:SAM-dependent methyltransferase
MKSIRYDYWADYIYDISSKYVNKDAKVLELGAGNGQLAFFLKKYYKDLVISDLSHFMLADSKNKKFKRVCCDMVSLPFKVKYDLIYSAFDCVNYLLTTKKLRKLFSEVKNYLTDVSLERNSLNHSNKPKAEGKVKNITYEHESRYNKKTRIHKNSFSITLPDGTKVRETHKQKIYLFEDYFKLFEKEDLFVVDCLDAFSFNDGKATSNRVQFILKKK